MKKEKIKIYHNLKEQFGNFDAKRKYAIFLKRKRLEKNLTLEEVSKGICTISYLSRIENNLVDVDEEYFVKLFNKLEIDFYGLKEEKEHEIFVKLLKLYLQKEETKIIDTISEALNTNYYVDLEYELMLLFDNILRKMYPEARNQIIELNDKIDVLLDNELVFYLFLSTLYAYRTNQCIFAYRQVLVLCEMQTIDFNYRYAIYDLALDIFDYVGAKEMFYKYYQLINEDDYLTYYSKSALKHKAQMIFYNYSLKGDETYNMLMELKEVFEDNESEEIDWLILKNDYRFSNINRCFELLYNKNPTPKLIAFESILVLASENQYRLSKLIDRRDGVLFEKTDQAYELMYNICILSKKEAHNIEVYNMMKELISIQFESDYDYFFFEIEKVLLMELAMKFSKYKECLKIIMDLNRIKDRMPYFL